MKTIGICFGSTTIQCVQINQNQDIIKIDMVERIAHEGNPHHAFLNLFKSIDLRTIDRVAVTGRSFRNTVCLTSISEPQAIECALKQEYKENDFPNMVISSGGETQLVYLVDKNGCIGAVHSGNKCASGTGEFFLQQIRRMGLSLEEAVEMANEGIPHKIAGRCSVFCKSDCTHALNKGEPRKNIAAGLCLMMADKITELVKDIKCEKAALIGGGSLNKAMVKILKSRFSNLDIPALSESFEAYGAAIWALQNKCLQVPENADKLVECKYHSFGVHKPLADAQYMVDFKEFQNDSVRMHDKCILGLDVGSTTTKAVLIRSSDSSILASVYLRTNGDPVCAARNCYKAILNKIADVKIDIEGLGVTGSGRQIAALHALSESVINEIVAHATAAAFFDKDVDTIFEIGGQDAKYTFLTGGVPSDYAMNEACSAGTGSFLEESARESLNVLTEEIGELALKGLNPPNFTDQCSAFISSDIKIASQEGVDKNDILAGLVYSICLNYLNRVKSSRPVGKKIFMQGGVCYNRAVPVAMASLMNCKIIVPPDPGLMGAFGVALEVKNRINAGFIVPQNFDLQTLIDREAYRESPVICSGGSEKCDRKCEISRIRIDEKLFLFGGACNKYYNLRFNKKIDTEKFDLVALRQKLAFEKYGVVTKHVKNNEDKPEKSVGILRSFLSHSIYPLYSNFFDQLGFRVILSDKIDPEGISRIESAFCLPAELTHGSFYNLLKKNPDYIFVPQVMQLPVANVQTYSRMCVFVQGEPYYLKATFRKELEMSQSVLLSPVLKMGNGYEAAEDTLVEMVKKIGISEKDARNAYLIACSKQHDFENELFEIGRTTLRYLDENPEMYGIVLFGRPYSAFAAEANMGISHKVASRGFFIIPHDMIPSDEVNIHPKMFWATGQKIMKSAQIVKQTNNLFGFYITNFSCGPDSYLLGYFRRLMGNKPSLTIELDQHTADAGIDTRIEAALDIIASYRKMGIENSTAAFNAAKVIQDKQVYVISSTGERYALTDPQVEIIVPSMGRYNTEVGAALYRSLGIDSKALPVPDKNILLEGRKNTTCKECLPYILITGSFLQYIRNRKDDSKVTLLFLPTGGGPCRLGQYYVAMEHLIERKKIKNAAVFTLTDENGYGGLGARTLLRAWMGIVISDVFSDIKSVINVAAKDKSAALETLESLWQEVVRFIEGRYSIRLTTLLESIASRLSLIQLKKNLLELPVISLIGEIYVRREEFSRKNIVDYLEEHGFVVKVAPVAEYLCYSNYVVNTGLGERQFSIKDQIKMKLTAQVQEWWEKRIKTILSTSGLYSFEMIEVEKTIKSANHLINENFRGEAILTVGLGLREILHDSCGVISIGPFGCMPSRVAESILKKEMNIDGKKRMQNWDDSNESYSNLDNFPFLALETDGSPFPQLIEANLEAFVLQAKRVHNAILNARKMKANPSFYKQLPVMLYDLVTGNGRNIGVGKSKKTSNY